MLQVEQIAAQIRESDCFLIGIGEAFAVGTKAEQSPLGKAYMENKNDWRGKQRFCQPSGNMWKSWTWWETIRPGKPKRSGPGCSRLMPSSPRSWRKSPFRGDHVHRRGDF